MNPPTIPPREWGFFSSHYNCATSCVYGSISKTMPMKYSHKQKRERNLEGGHLIHLERKTSQQTIIKESQHWARGYEALWFQHRGKKKMNHAKNESTFKVNICRWVCAHVIVTEQGTRTQYQFQKHSFPIQNHLVFHTCLLRGWSFPLWDSLNVGKYSCVSCS